MEASFELEEIKKSTLLLKLKPHGILLVRSNSFVFEPEIIQITWEIDPYPFDFKERFLEKAGSAEAGFAVGHYEVCEFFARVEFDNQPGQAR